MDLQLAIVMVAMVAGAVTLIVSSLLLRYRRRELEHKERLAAMEKGMPLLPLARTDRNAPWSPRLYLLRGLVWLFSGIALMVFLVMLSLTSDRPLSTEDRARRANWLKQAGASEEQVREVWRDTSAHNDIPLGFAFLGLVPLGVGAAYLIFYRIEGRKMLASEPPFPASGTK